MADSLRHQAAQVGRTSLQSYIWRASMPSRITGIFKIGRDMTSEFISFSFLFNFYAFFCTWRVFLFMKISFQPFLLLFFRICNLFSHEWHKTSLIQQLEQIPYIKLLCLCIEDVTKKNSYILDRANLDIFEVVLLTGM